MDIQIELITPEVADIYLLNNKSNRKLSKAHVLHLARQMEKGEWKSTGDAVKFSKSGRLLDGQHRLSAISKSGVPQYMVIIRGLEDEVFDVLDSGKGRNAGDVLSTLGIANPKKVATVAKFAILYSKGKFSSIEWGNSNSSDFTNSKIREFVEKDSEIEGIVTDACKLFANFKAIAFQPLAGMYYVIKKTGDYRAEEFFEKLTTGANLGVDDPVYALREKFIKNSLNPYSKLSVSDSVFYIAKAWVMFQKEKPAKSISRGKKESFPVIDKFVEIKNDSKISELPF